MHIVNRAEARALTFFVPAALEEWVTQRAAILGVSRQQLCSDVLSYYATLVNQDELRNGIRYDEQTVEVPPINEPYAGYRDRIRLRHTPSHLDSALAGLEVL